MEVYKEEKSETKPKDTITQIKKSLFNYIGIILMVIGVVVMFVIASLETTKEIKANSSVSGKLLTEWRLGQVNEEKVFPTPLTDIVELEGKEFYFVIDEINAENGEIITWHFEYQIEMPEVIKEKQTKPSENTILLHAWRVEMEKDEYTLPENKEIFINDEIKYTFVVDKTAIVVEDDIEYEIVTKWHWDYIEITDAYLVDKVATKAQNGKLITKWQIEANDLGQIYPEEKTEIMKYKYQGQERDFYFVIDKFSNDGKILKWHYAYDGSFAYIFGDYKFYVLTALSILIALLVSFVNYISTIQKAMKQSWFLKTLEYYKRKKDKVESYTQYIPDFCAYKNQQLYETAKRDIVESADISYKWYLENHGKGIKIAPWQTKILKKIQKIKIEKLHSSDLLQEDKKTTKKLKMLPMGQAQHQRRFMFSGLFSKTITAFAGGLVIVFGVILTDWTVGLSYAFTVFLAYAAAVIIANEFAENTLRNRFIAKGDLLGEFDNMKDKFIQKEESIKKEEREENENGDNEIERL